MKIFLAMALFALCLPATVHYLTVSGLGGEPDYELRFTALAADLDKLLKASPGEVAVHTLSGKQATKAQLTSIMALIAGAAKNDDSLVVLLIGHGSFDGHDYKFNLVGPDISAVELAALCDRVSASRQLVVNMTSSSGAAIPALQKKGRAVITATKSGTEKNATVFARYWVDALRDPAADTDKNDVISALEAFHFAVKKTTGFYETQKRIATEHAMLEDVGDGDAVRDPSPQNGQGLLAGAFPVLRLGASHQAVLDPAKQKLLARKEQIEQGIDKLKYEKAAMPLEEYRKQLTTLLLELARIQEELDK
ncbi:MAG: hypothetical protein FJW20_06825 [Acidimicrobiia bacterium]|nr:hypothetical protein [Acidimicrobiia bacterium]